MRLIDRLAVTAAALVLSGSISAAARQLGMSYRRAWLLVDEMNKMFREPVVETRGGGRNGGGAVLTELGESVVTLYRCAEAKIMAGAAAEISALEEALSSPSPPA